MDNLIPDDDLAGTFLSEEDLFNRADGDGPARSGPAARRSAAGKGAPRSMFQHVEATVLHPPSSTDAQTAAARRERSLHGPIRRDPYTRWRVAAGRARAAMEMGRVWAVSAGRSTHSALSMLAADLRRLASHGSAAARTRGASWLTWGQSFGRSRFSSGSLALSPRRWSAGAAVAAAFVAGVSIGAIVISMATGQSRTSPTLSPAIAAAAPAGTTPATAPANLTAMAGPLLESIDDRERTPDTPAPTSGTKAGDSASSQPNAVAARTPSPAAPASARPARPQASAGARSARRTTTTGFRGSLAVRSQPAGAAVFVNGQPVGKTPLLLTDQTVGSRAVRITLEGYETWTSGARVVANQQQVISASLRPVDAVTATIGVR